MSYSASRMIRSADLGKLRQHVTALASSPEFVHHEWYVVHHLSIMESLIDELLPRYPEANGEVTRAMTWVHDWGAIITNNGEHEQEATIQHIHATLPAFGYNATQIQQIEIVYTEMETLKPHGADFLMETRIASSADAMSHYIGPFAAIYWHENPGKPIPTLVQDVLSKADNDVKRMLLPEVKKFAEPRIRRMREFFPPNRPRRYF